MVLAQRRIRRRGRLRAKTDLHLSFAPQIYQELNWSAMYLCNQRIYSPRHARHEPLQLDRVTPDRPLRCVEYRVPSLETNNDARQLWLDYMCRRYDLVGRETFPFVRLNKKDRDLICVDYLEVYKFVPKNGRRPGGTRRKAASARQLH